MIASEETVFFTAGSLRLEGQLHRTSGSNAVVVTHPHPLYGGEMSNPVVIALTTVYQQLGYTTLRFNFRGVGASEGQYDDGNGERDDVRAAATYLTDLGKTVSDLAGYSFGAWVNLRLQPSLTTVQRQVLISPPVAFLDFGAVLASPAELIVFVGDRDNFAPSDMLQAQLLHWSATTQLHTLPVVDHFYSGATNQLIKKLSIELGIS